MIRTSYRSGEWDFAGLYESGDWEPKTHEILGRFLHPGSLFLDVGAWCGPVTLWACDLGATVVALEPDEEARRVLIANTKDRDVSVLPYALSNAMGIGLLTNDGYFGNSESRLAMLPRNANGYPDETRQFPAYACMRTVERRTPKYILRWVYDNYGRYPDLIKVDIEGNEIDVVPLLAPLCAKHRIPLFVSWHQDWWPRPYPREEREAWFDGLDCEEGREWMGFGDTLAVPPPQ